jgi:protein phosphatase
MGMSFRVQGYGLTHIGMKRKNNQDNFILVPEQNLFVVADGMGGHKGGETASAIAVATIADFYKSGSPGNNPVKRMQQAIVAANAAIQKKGSTDASLQGMGTTTVAIHFNGTRAFVGHVGDSRCYLVHPDRIWQVTRDHSLVQEKLRAGLITRAQLKTDRMKNVITRSVGFEDEVNVDVYQLEPHPGDVFVMCSDGLSGMVDDSEIKDIISDLVFNKGDAEGACKQLIDSANEHGGDDNVTVVMVRVV